jgi:preprotein translocase subunit SecG
MSNWFIILTIIFVVVSLAMVLIILVQRPQGGGLAGAFGGAGGSGTETIFGGRVGDALTYMTVVAFVCSLSLAIALNLLDNIDPDAVASPPEAATSTFQQPLGAPSTTIPTLPGNLSPVPSTATPTPAVPVTPTPAATVPPASGSSDG